MSIDRERLARAMSNHEDEREEERGDREHCCDFGCAPAIADAYEVAAPGVERDERLREALHREVMALDAGTICECGLAKSYHDGRLQPASEYRPRYVLTRASVHEAIDRALTAALSTPETPGAPES